MNTIYTIKENKINTIELEENIKDMISNPRSNLTKKFKDKGYSLIINDKDNIVVCINENITTLDKDNIISIFSKVKEENPKIYNIKCFNYLQNNDYDSMNKIEKENAEIYINNICREKLKDLNPHLETIFKDYREFDLKKSLRCKYAQTNYAPSSFNSGVILIKEDSKIEKSLTKMTHEELINELENTSSYDLYTNKNTIVYIVSGYTGMIFIPDNINDFQRKELENIKNIINTSYTDTYIDVIKVKGKDMTRYVNINEYFSKQKKKVK